jgi:hypothetical protein
VVQYDSVVRAARSIRTGENEKSCGLWEKSCGCTPHIATTITHTV